MKSKKSTTDGGCGPTEKKVHTTRNCKKINPGKADGLYQYKSVLFLRSELHCGSTST